MFTVSIQGYFLKAGLQINCMVIVLFMLGLFNMLLSRFVHTIFYFLRLGFWRFYNRDILEADFKREDIL